MSHEPTTIPAFKMDAHVPMFKGSCSCGWSGNGLHTSKSQALKDARQHADAKNMTVDELLDFIQSHNPTGIVTVHRLGEEFWTDDELDTFAAMCGPGSTLEAHQFGDRKVRLFIGDGVRLAVVD